MVERRENCIVMAFDCSGRTEQQLMHESIFLICISCYSVENGLQCFEFNPGYSRAIESMGNERTT